MKKINILAHRGMWGTIEKNSQLALFKALENGFGLKQI